MEQTLQAIENHPWTCLALALFILIVIGEIISPWLHKYDKDDDK